MSDDTLTIPPAEPTPPRPSPKRKRTDSVSFSATDDIPFAPQLDVKLRPLPDYLQKSVSPQPGLSYTEATSPITPRKQDPDVRGFPHLPGASSPRTIIAKDFGNLSLRGGEGTLVRFGHGVGAENKPASKKARTDEFGLDGTLDSGPRELGDHESTDKSWVVRHAHGVWQKVMRTEMMKAALEDTRRSDSSIHEIPETPQQQMNHTRHDENPRSQHHKHISVELVLPSIEHHDHAATYPKLLSTSSKFSAPRELSRARQKSASKSPPPYTLDLSSLTWHDDEITGHLGLDPDDDGTGINGVGFKPTPAIAYARSQKRKKQVAEWKRREAGEERRRRMEARRRSGYLGAQAIPHSSAPELGSTAGEVGEQRRVRFAEV